jgi:hypothetical protein
MSYTACKANGCNAICESYTAICEAHKKYLTPETRAALRAFQGAWVSNKTPANLAVFSGAEFAAIEVINGHLSRAQTIVVDPLEEIKRVAPIKNAQPYGPTPKPKPRPLKSDLKEWRKMERKNRR